MVRPAVAARDSIEPPVTSTPPMMQQLRKTAAKAVLFEAESAVASRLEPQATSEVSTKRQLTEKAAAAALETKRAPQQAPEAAALQER